MDPGPREHFLGDFPQRRRQLGCTLSELHPVLQSSQLPVTGQITAMPWIPAHKVCSALPHMFGGSESCRQPEILGSDRQSSVLPEGAPCIGKVGPGRAQGAELRTEAQAGNQLAMVGPGLSAQELVEAYMKLPHVSCHSCLSRAGRGLCLGNGQAS